MLKNDQTFARMLSYVLPLLHAHEQLYLFAYPDPASKMGQALGHRGIVKVGNTGVIPKHVQHLSGSPWTIGWGQTGKDIKPGTRWTRRQADDALYMSVLHFYQQMEVVWPSSRKLPAAVQAALVSLLYNRGTSLEKRPNDPLDRRREMREIGPAVIAQDIPKIIELIHSMKRLWEGKHLNGLIARRDDEIKLCQQALEEV